MQSFEVPYQRFGEVLSHDVVLHNSDQERIQQLVDSIGLGAIAAHQVIEMPDSVTSIETVDTHGQYL